MNVSQLNARRIELLNEQAILGANMQEGASSAPAAGSSRLGAIAAEL